MSDLIAIAYPDEATADRAHANLAQGVKDGVIAVEDVVLIVRHENGTVDVRQGSSGVGMAAAGGAAWGGLIGLVVFAPLLGMAVGAVAGGAAWKSTMGDVGIDESFVSDLSDHLTPGSAALVVLVRDLAPDDVLPHIEEGGHVIRTSLSPEVEAQLDAALAAARSDSTSD